MVAIKLEPIKVQSTGGYDVVITALSPTQHDCIVGEITTPGLGTISGEWNLSGTLRSGTSNCNLDMSFAELAELATLAKQLGAKP